MSIIDNHDPEFEKALLHFQTEISQLKTGRANPAMLDSIMVDSYGSKAPLNQVASISVPEARSIVIQPWDKSILAVIEKAIKDSDLDVNVVNEGERVRVTMPLMTEESRQAIVKTLHHKMEEAKVMGRNIRDKIKEEILEAEKNKEFGEDEKFTLLKDLDKKNSDYNTQIDDLGRKKEEEIMKV